MDLMGSAITEENLRLIFQDSLKSETPEDARITYDDFLLLMKGQTKCVNRKGESSPDHNHAKVNVGGRNAAVPLMPSLSGRMTTLLEAVQEIPEKIQEANEEEESASSTDGYGINKTSQVFLSKDTSYASSNDAELSWLVKSNSSDSDAVPMEPRSPPFTRLPALGRVSQPSRHNRLMSRSFDEKDLTERNEGDGGGSSPLTLGANLIIALPEHSHESSVVTDLINDPAKTPLVVNRELYRAHRIMRLSVLEASKRFEEKKLLLVQKELNEKPFGVRTGAGLVMRHGLEKQMSSSAIRSLLRERERQTRQQIDDVVKRTGRERPRKNRKKTVSDMSGFLISPNTSRID
jgi:hypothetical protein